MNIKDLYDEMKRKLKQMYDTGKKEIVLDQTEFFAVYKVICDMMTVKHITDSQ